MVILDELRFKNSGPVFNVETNMCSIEVQRVQFEIRVDEAWVTIQAVIPFRHKLLAEFTLELLVIFKCLHYARTWLLSFNIRMY